MAFMRLQSRVVELEKEALTKNGVIEILRKLISERNPQNLIESLALQSVERIQRQGKRVPGLGVSVDEFRPRSWCI